MSAPRPEVYRRLLFAKYLFTSGEAACRTTNDQFAFTKGLLLFHDAADNALGAVADHLGASVTGRETLPEMFTPIKSADAQHRAIPYTIQLLNLNTIRNNAKHKGILPDVRANLHLPATIEEFLSTVCREYCDLSFEGLSLKGTLTDPKVLEQLDRADAAMAKEDYEGALVALGYAMFHACEADSVWDALLTQPIKNEGIEWVTPYSVKHAVRLLCIGIDVNDYWRFKRLTPRMAMMRDTNEPTHSWGNDYGHPANWTKDNAQFCYRVCVEAALASQSRSESEPKLVDFVELYENEITPSRDGIAVYDFPRASNLSEMLARKEPPKQIATLNTGDVLLGYATDSEEHFDLWLVMSGDLKSRTSNGWGHGYVAKADVEVKRRPRG